MKKLLFGLLILNFLLSFRFASDGCVEIHCHQCGLMLAERFVGTVTDDDGCGVINCDQSFIKYDEELEIGDEVVTWIFYNPFSDADDAVIYRSDFVL